MTKFTNASLLSESSGSLSFFQTGDSNNVDNYGDTTPATKSVCKYHNDSRLTMKRRSTVSFLHSFQASNSLNEKRSASLTTLDSPQTSVAFCVDEQPSKKQGYFKFWKLDEVLGWVSNIKKWAKEGEQISQLKRVPSMRKATEQKIVPGNKVRHPMKKSLEGTRNRSSEEISDGEEDNVDGICHGHLQQAELFCRSSSHSHAFTKGESQLSSRLPNSPYNLPKVEIVSLSNDGRASAQSSLPNTGKKSMALQSSAFDSCHTPCSWNCRLCAFPHEQGHSSVRPRMRMRASETSRRCSAPSSLHYFISVPRMRRGSCPFSFPRKTTATFHAPLAAFTLCSKIQADCDKTSVQDPSRKRQKKPVGRKKSRVILGRYIKRSEQATHTSIVEKTMLNSLGGCKVVSQSTSFIPMLLRKAFASCARLLSTSWISDKFGIHSRQNVEVFQRSSIYNQRGSPQTAQFSPHKVVPSVLQAQLLSNQLNQGPVASLSSLSSVPSYSDSPYSNNSNDLAGHVSAHNDSTSHGNEIRIQSTATKMVNDDHVQHLKGEKLKWQQGMTDFKCQLPPQYKSPSTLTRFLFASRSGICITTCQSQGPHELFFYGNSVSYNRLSGMAAGLTFFEDPRKSYFPRSKGKREKVKAIALSPSEASGNTTSSNQAEFDSADSRFPSLNAIHEHSSPSEKKHEGPRTSLLAKDAVHASSNGLHLPIRNVRDKRCECNRDGQILSFITSERLLEKSRTFIADLREPTKPDSDCQRFHQLIPQSEDAEDLRLEWRHRKLRYSSGLICEQLSLRSLGRGEAIALVCPPFFKGSNYAQTNSSFPTTLSAATVGASEKLLQSAFASMVYAEDAQNGSTCKFVEHQSLCPRAPHKASIHLVSIHCSDTNERIAYFLPGDQTCSDVFKKLFGGPNDERHLTIHNGEGRYDDSLSYKNVRPLDKNGLLSSGFQKRMDAQSSHAWISSAIPLEASEATHSYLGSSPPVDSFSRKALSVSIDSPRRALEMLQSYNSTAGGANFSRQCMVLLDINFPSQQMPQQPCPGKRRRNGNVQDDVFTFPTSTSDMSSSCHCSVRVTERRKNQPRCLQSIYICEDTNEKTRGATYIRERVAMHHNSKSISKFSEKSRYSRAQDDAFLSGVALNSQNWTRKAIQTKLVTGQHTAKAANTPLEEYLRWRLVRFTASSGRNASSFLFAVDKFKGKESVDGTAMPDPGKPSLSIQRHDLQPLRLKWKNTLLMANEVRPNHILVYHSKGYHHSPESEIKNLHLLDHLRRITGCSGRQRRRRRLVTIFFSGGVARTLSAHVKKAQQSLEERVRKIKEYSHICRSTSALFHYLHPPRFLRTRRNEKTFIHDTDIRFHKIARRSSTSGECEPYKSGESAGQQKSVCELLSEEVTRSDKDASNHLRSLNCGVCSSSGPIARLTKIHLSSARNTTVSEMELEETQSSKLLRKIDNNVIFSVRKHHVILLQAFLKDTKVVLEETWSKFCKKRILRSRLRPSIPQEALATDWASTSLSPHTSRIEVIPNNYVLCPMTPKRKLTSTVYVCHPCMLRLIQSAREPVNRANCESEPDITLYPKSKCGIGTTVGFATKGFTPELNPLCPHKDTYCYFFSATNLRGSVNYPSKKKFRHRKSRDSCFLIQCTHTVTNSRRFKVVRGGKTSISLKCFDLKAQGPSTNVHAAKLCYTKNQINCCKNNLFQSGREIIILFALCNSCYRNLKSQPQSNKLLLSSCFNNRPKIRPKRDRIWIDDSASDQSIESFHLIRKRTPIADDDLQKFDGNITATKRSLAPTTVKPCTKSLGLVQACLETRMSSFLGKDEEVDSSLSNVSPPPSYHFPESFEIVDLVSPTFDNGSLLESFFSRKTKSFNGDVGQKVGLDEQPPVGSSRSEDFSTSSYTFQSDRSLLLSKHKTHFNKSLVEGGSRSGLTLSDQQFTCREAHQIEGHEDLKEEKSNDLCDYSHIADGKVVSINNRLEQRSLLRSTNVFPLADAIQSLGIDWWSCSFDDITNFFIESIRAFEFFGSFNSLPTSTLEMFFRVVAGSYRKSNPYHNFFHGIQVYHVTWLLLSKHRLSDYLIDGETLGVLIGALCHDVDHPGLSNEFFVNIQHPTALLYNDVSVLENHHCAFTFKLLESCEQIDFRRNMSGTDQRHFRRAFIRGVLATDMQVHFQNLTKFSNRLQRRELEPFSIASAEDRNFLIEMVPHAADISNCVTPDPYFQRWASLIVEEFNLQCDKESIMNLEVTSFMNCRTEKSRAESQMGFVKFLVLPVWRALALLEPGLESIVDQGESNVQYWRSVVEETTKNPNCSSNFSFSLSNIKERHPLAVIDPKQIAITRSKNQMGHLKRLD